MLTQVTNHAELVKVFIVRGIVFIEEQQVSYNEEIDQHEGDSVHILGECEGEPMAAGRIRFVDGYAKLERIAIRRAYRGRGHGHALVEYMLDLARAQGAYRFLVSAQAHLVDFYAAHGFVPEGPRYLEANIEHVKMVRKESAPLPSAD